MAGRNFTVRGKNKIRRVAIIGWKGNEQIGEEKAKTCHWGSKRWKANGEYLKEVSNPNSRPCEGRPEK